jgi:hypothetical protein
MQSPRKSSGSWMVVVADPFDNLTQVQRHEQQAKADPARWLPWNYREQLGQPPPARHTTAEHRRKGFRGNRWLSRPPLPAAHGPHHPCRPDPTRLPPGHLMSKLRIEPPVKIRLPNQRLAPRSRAISRPHVSGSRGRCSGARSEQRCGPFARSLRHLAFFIRTGTGHPCFGVSSVFGVPVLRVRLSAMRERDTIAVHPRQEFTGTRKPVLERITDVKEPS